MEPNQGLPPDFEYLSAACDLIQPLWLSSQMNERACGLTHEAHGVLATAYDEIVRREDIVAISDWLRETERKREANQEANLYARKVYELFRTFEILGEDGVEPFVGGHARLLEARCRPDWSVLPPDLKYLAEPAERFGIYQSDSDITRLCETIGDADLDYLAGIASRIKRSGDNPAIIRWLRGQNMVTSYEAALISYLFMVFDALDLEC